MIYKKILLLLAIFSCLGCIDSAQESSPESDRALSSSPAVSNWDFSTTVVPLTELKKKVGYGIEVQAKSGTGFCLDSACRFIVTNYHLAAQSQLRRIKGDKVVQTYFATGPEDDDATVNVGLGMPKLKYTLSRDLAIFELRQPLRRYHGAPFSLKDLQVGREVDIYAYPLEGVNPIRRSLMRFHGTFKGDDATGLLTFDYDLSDNKALRPGASGGIVVDSKTQQIVGVLNALERYGKHIAFAVPIQALADFLSKVDPSLALLLFPSAKIISPESPDLYPRPTFSHVGILEHRPQEPSEVRMLRTSAQLLADSMRNFIAVQTFAWGRGDHEPSFESAYEVRVMDGSQHFREYPDGKTESAEHGPLPPLNTAMSTGAEWSSLPALVGTDIGLKIQQAADAVVKGQQIKVFQYWADPEDRACQFLTIVDYVLFTRKNVSSVACYGEVWTDKNFNILRMSEHLELLGKWKNYQGVVTYGWLRPRNGAPQLIPLTISNQAEFKKQIYWCRGRFTNYQMFSTRVEMKAANVEEQQ